MNIEKALHALNLLIENGKVQVTKTGDGNGWGGSYKEKLVFPKANAKFGSLLFPKMDKHGTNSSHSVTHSYDEDGNVTIVKKGWWASEGQGMPDGRILEPPTPARKAV